MITVERIYIRNIRAIGEAEVLPLTDGGMTALNGSNGAGKSTVLASLLFALYGVTPDGVPIPALRRQGSDGQDCRAEVTFIYDGQKITVERGLKGARDATYVRVSVDGVEQTFGKVREAQRWINNHLGGLDSEAFLTVVAVRQKELDGLIKSTPAERRKLIERLAGIDRMSTAVATAREEERDGKRRVEMLPGDPEAFTAAQQALDQAQTRAAALWDERQNVEKQAVQAERDLSEAEEASAKLSAAIREHQNAKDAAAAATADLRLAELALEQATAEHDKLAAAAEGGDEQTLAAARAVLREAQQRAEQGRDIIRAAETAAGEAERAARAEQQARAVAQQAQREAENAHAAVSALQPAAEADPELLRQAMIDAESLAEQTSDRYAALRAEYDRLSKAIAALSEAHNAACPTCEHPLDDPAALAALLTEQRDRVKTDGTAAASAAASAKTAASLARDAVTTHAAARREYEHAETAATAAADAAMTARLAADSAAQEHADARARAEQAAAAAAAAESDHGSILSAMEQAAAQVRAVENAAASAAALPAAAALLDKRRADTQVAREHAAHATQTEQELRVSDTLVERCQANHATAQAAFKTANQAARDAQVAFEVANEQANSAERLCELEREKIQARADAVNELERLTAVRTALDDFRKDRIARLAPELSEIASDLIPHLTNGRFVSVELDEEFTPILTDQTGHRRPATWLSGGEESNVALALRIAIRDVVGGTRGGLLILDEVLTAQDEQRRTATMAAIRDLPGIQPIVINHVSEATDMVDLVLDVVPDPDNGSSVRPANVYGVVAEAALDG